MAKQIKLTQGKFALVDDDDFERLNKFKWCIGSGGYAIRDIKRNGKNKREYMHRIINQTPKELFTDHINGNKLDNRKENLRNCTTKQNAMNVKVHKDNYLGEKGIYIHTNHHPSKSYKYFRARIMVNGECIHIGLFKTLENAITARVAAEKKYQGEYARG